MAWKWRPKDSVAAIGALMTTSLAMPLPSGPAIAGDLTGDCYVCGSRIRIWLEVPKSDGSLRAVGICRCCGHAAHPASDTAANLECQRRYFDGHVPPLPRAARWPQRYALLRRRLRRLGARGGTALDIGCGNGAWLSALGDGWTRFGVELSEPTARAARLATGADVFCGPVEQYRPPLPAFDLISAFALIEHLSEPRRLVRWCREHLKPGGWFLVMTGDRESQTACAMESAWPLYHPAEHQHFFSAGSLCRLLESESFEVVRSEWHYMPWQPCPPLRRFLLKCREAAGLVTQPAHDHLYLFARKPAIPKAHLRTEDNR